jgi:YD repeat-containing protein
MPPSPATADTTEYWRDGDGNTVATQDPDGNTTSWIYNGLGEQVQETTPLGSYFYVYNSAQGLVQSTDADGRTIVYVYNGIGQEVAENWYTSTNTSVSPAETIGLGYNAAGQVQTATDDNTAADCPTAAIDTFAYDTAGDVTSETQQIPGLTPIVTFTSQYTAGDRTQLAASIGGTADFVNNYQYSYNEMVEVTQSGDGGDAVANKEATFDYDSGCVGPPRLYNRCGGCLNPQE